MEQKFSDVISLRRRDTRSINLERDLAFVDSVLGYIPTSWAISACERIIHALTTRNSIRAWTITGVYGTGKSAFAHFLSALIAPKADPIHINAQSILEQHLGHNHPLVSHLRDHLPETGCIRAVATAQREPLGYTIIRALRCGCELAWPQTFEQERSAYKFEYFAKKMQSNQKITNQEIVHFIRQIAQETHMEILLVIDELGKGLEYAAWHQENDDLYLLQQLAELPAGVQSPKVFVLGLLHQSFTEYAQNLTKTQRNEWSKIQGRFEDIPFTSSNDHMLYLMSQAIDHSKAQELLPFLNAWAVTWQQTLHDHSLHQERFSVDEFINIYPLHPIAAFALPILCSRYAQNDRSLFTFLTSQEPYSFQSFLQETLLQERQPTTLKLDRVYDYFIETSSISNSAKASTQRWIEIQGRIIDAQHLNIHLVMTLKTVGILNLVASVGALRATPQIVIQALSEDPTNDQEVQRWSHAIEILIKRGLVTHRKQLDELRIWEGSDFDIEQAITSTLEKEQASLAVLLTRTNPLPPLITQRHTYQTATLRYFERRYISTFEDLAHIGTGNFNIDGLKKGSIPILL